MPILIRPRVTKRSEQTYFEPRLPVPDFCLHFFFSWNKKLGFKAIDFIKQHNTTATSHLDLCILRACEDRVLPECHGLNSSFMALKGHDRKHILQVPYL